MDFNLGRERRMVHGDDTWDQAWTLTNEGLGGSRRVSC